MELDYQIGGIRTSLGNQENRVQNQNVGRKNLICFESIGDHQSRKIRTVRYSYTSGSVLYFELYVERGTRYFSA